LTRIKQIAADNQPKVPTGNDGKLTPAWLEPEKTAGKDIFDRHFTWNKTVRRGVIGWDISSRALVGTAISENHPPQLKLIGFRQWHRITAHLFKGSRSELATAQIQLFFPASTMPTLGSRSYL
jgi:hypothetical protein